MHCTPQTITNYCKRGVSEQQVAEIAAALEVSEKELYRTEAENEFYALKKIDLQKALLATRKGRLILLQDFHFWHISCISMVELFRYLQPSSCFYSLKWWEQ